MLTFILFHADLFSEIDELEGVADELTLEIIDVVVSFVELAASTEKNKGKKFTTVKGVAYL